MAKKQNRASQFVAQLNPDQRLVFIPSERETQTSFYADGSLRINLCSFEQGRVADVLPLSSPSPLKQRGVLRTLPDGTSTFSPYQVSGRQIYHSIYATECAELKKSSRHFVFTLKFPVSHGILSAVDLANTELLRMSEVVRSRFDVIPFGW